MNSYKKEFQLSQEEQKIKYNNKYKKQKVICKK